MSATLHCQKSEKENIQLLERHPYDFYPTDDYFVQSAVNLVTVNPDWIMDTGSGSGVFGRYTRKRWQDANIVGIEIRQDAPFMNYYDWNIRADFLSMTPEINMFDLVIGNPPYSHAESFIRHAMKSLRNGGELIYLLRLSFLESMGRYNLFTHEMQPRQIVVCSDRPSFTGNGKTDASAYAFFVWEKGYTGECNLSWKLSKPTNFEKYGTTQLKMFT